MYYFRLISTHLRLGILNDLQYRVNFWAQLLQTIVGSSTAIGSLAIIFQHTDDLAGWHPDELLVLVGIYFLMRSAIQTFIQPSLTLFMEDVRQGTLDYTIIKPVDSQLLVSIRRVAIWNTFDGLVGICIIIYAVAQLRYELGGYEALTFVLTLLCGAVIVYSFWLILATIAFWFIRVENILVIFESMYQAGRWPVGIYPQFLQLLLTFLVPIAFAVTVPAEALTGRLTRVDFGLALVLAVALFIVARRFWNFGIKHYSGASA
ncbi:MAG: ABC-2 family transporter protein [Chloroflexota bacterium]